MRHIKLFENFKSDEDIAKEFDGMSVEEIKLEARDMSYMFAPETFQADIMWSFPDGDEHVGGGTTSTSEDFIYNVPGKAFKYATNAWYPEEVYQKMISVIKEELKKKYNADFEWMKDIDFIRKFDK